MLENVEGGMTKYVPFSDVMPIYGATMRIDTIDEVAYYRHGGILHYVLHVLRGMAKAA